MARRFREAWKPFLDSKGMEFFHATDDFRRPDAEEIFSSLAKLTKDTALRGCINFLSDKELTRLSKSGAQRYAGSGFSTSTLGCMKLMADMAREQNRRIVYFIEGGNRFAGELRHFLSQIKERPQQIDQYAMAGADTYDKKDVIQLQAADLFAWSFTRSHYRGSWAEAVFMLTKDRVLPHTMTSFDPVMLAMVNSFHGMRSNRKRFS